MAQVNVTKHRPVAVDHHQLAAQLVVGHQAIAAAVAEWAAHKAERLEAARALYGAESQSERPAVPGG